MARPVIDIDSLTPSERLDLIEVLWESLSTDPSQIPVTPAQRAELDRRLDEMEKDGGRGIPIDEALTRIRSKP